MLQDTGQERICILCYSITLAIDAKMGVQSTTASEAVGSRVQRSSQAMVLGDVLNDTSRLVEYIDGLEGLEAGEWERPLPRCSLCMELRQVDINFSQGFNNLFDHRENFDLLIGHVGP